MTSFRREIGKGLVVVSTQDEHAEALAELQKVVFPTLAQSELFAADHYRSHLEVFPEGQFVAIDESQPDGEIVGMTSTLRLDESCRKPHTFAEVTAGGYLTTHNPTGQWLYGVDIGVHPDWRGRGIGRALYSARHQVAQELDLDGQVTVGMLSGYGTVRDDMTAEQYLEELADGKRIDPTVSAQQKLGFEIRGLVKGYVDDPVCAGCGALLVLIVDKRVAWPSAS